jgi:hypothetical protein
VFSVEPIGPKRDVGSRRPGVMGTSLRRPSSTSSMNSANWAGMHLTRRWQRRLGKKLIAWTERLQYCASSGLPYSALCSRIAISHVPILDDLPRASGTVVDSRRSEGGDGRPALSRADHLIQREFPRLCRGGSQSLTDPGVYPVGTRTRNGRMSDLTLPLCAWFASPASLNFGSCFQAVAKRPL